MKNRRPAKRLLAGIAVFAGLGTCWSQTEDLPGADPEIAAIEQAFVADATASRDELGAQYLDALSKLQGELESAGNDTDASAVQLEIERISQFLSTSQESSEISLDQFTPSSALIEFPLTEAELARGVRISDDGAQLIGFFRPGASATWELPGSAAEGKYEVLVRFSSARGEGGGFNVSIDDTQEVSQTIMGTGEWGQERLSYVGDLELDGRSAEISVSVRGIARQELFRLHGLTLAPPGTWERRQAEVATGGAGGSETEKEESEFRKLTRVRYISDSTNEGDTAYFLVDGERQRLRTYFVRTPVNASDKLMSGEPALLKRVQEAAKYFELKPTEAADLGAAATEFTRRMLVGKDLTVYTMGKPAKDTKTDPEGVITYLAFIVANGELLSKALVENGFGMLVGAPTLLPDGRNPQTYYQTLREAERKAQEAGAGGWSGSSSSSTQ
ncbi:MAG: thermonuclease family protein [Verrucomicrobiota bacterium]